eukprot:5377104-Amphidinium_carterae.1
MAGAPNPRGRTANSLPDHIEADEPPSFTIWVWAGIARSMDEVGSDLATLLAILRMSPSTPCRLLAALNEDQWFAFLGEWLPGGVQPNAAQLASAMLTYKTCRERFSSTSAAARKPLDTYTSTPISDTPTPTLARLNTILNQ